MMFAPTWGGGCIPCVGSSKVRVGVVSIEQDSDDLIWKTTCLVQERWVHDGVIESNLRRIRMRMVEPWVGENVEEP
jgi:hypothetical protein